MDNFRAVILAILVHLVLLAMLIVTLDWTPDTGSVEPKVDVVQAVTVDHRKVEAELKRIEQFEARKHQEELERQQRLKRQAERAKKAREVEETRLARAKQELEDNQARAQAERKRLAKIQQEQDRLEKERRAEERRLAQVEAERKIAAERKRQIELERERVEKEKRKAESERKRIEAEKHKAEAERKRIEAEKRKAETERKRIVAEKRKAEAERKRIEEEKRRKQAELEIQTALAEEQQLLLRRRQSLKARYFNEYVGGIKNKVQRVWRRPVGVQSGLSCKIRVAQIPGGEVVGATVIKSSGNVQFDRSVEAAVLKASPLPRPKDPDLFEREIVFIFEPED